MADTTATTAGPMSPGLLARALRAYGPPGISTGDAVILMWYPPDHYYRDLGVRPIRGVNQRPWSVHWNRTIIRGMSTGLAGPE